MLLPGWAFLERWRTSESPSIQLGKATVPVSTAIKGIKQNKFDTQWLGVILAWELILRGTPGRKYEPWRFRSSLFELQRGRRTKVTYGSRQGCHESQAWQERPSHFFDHEVQGRMLEISDRRHLVGVCRLGPVVRRSGGKRKDAGSVSRLGPVVKAFGW